jgi:2-oxoglutarate dehydrogenase E2 component (dihydrolipoamide succinyltransferase)
MTATEFKMPRLGESVSEATILEWRKQPGDAIEPGDILLEVGTDKVNSELPFPRRGVLREILRNAQDVVPVGEVIARIDIDDADDADAESSIAPASAPTPAAHATPSAAAASSAPTPAAAVSQKPLGFLSPLVRAIALAENLTLEELQAIPGTGHDGRIRKSDVFQYLRHRRAGIAPGRAATGSALRFPKPTIPIVEGRDRIIEMDRMRRMIADHMVYSKHTAPHVTAFIEIDVTDLCAWHAAVRDAFQQTHGVKLTLTPLFLEAVARALGEFPMMNASIDDDRIITHADVNIGMATAMPDGNLIVPVVKQAGAMGLPDLARRVNALADAARSGRLQPDDVQGGTFTISNVGTFGSLMGTPIINQPQAAILAFGAIQRRPAVIDTPQGEQIAIRRLMFLSLSFDHRAIDGWLGGSFLRKVGDLLEQVDPARQP